MKCFLALFLSLFIVTGAFANDRLAYCTEVSQAGYVLLKEGDSGKWTSLNDIRLAWLDQKAREGYDRQRLFAMNQRIEAAMLIIDQHRRQLSQYRNYPDAQKYIKMVCYNLRT